MVKSYQSFIVNLFKTTLFGAWVSLCIITRALSSTTVSTPTPTFNTALSNANGQATYNIGFDPVGTPFSIASSPNILNSSTPLILTMGNSLNPVTLQRDPSTANVRLLRKTNSNLTLILQNLTISGFNSVDNTSSGGAIYLDTNSLTLTCNSSTTFSNNAINYNNGNGGAISVNNGDLVLNGSGTLIFKQNTAPTALTGGGALYGQTSVQINGTGITLFTQNSSVAGGAVRSAAFSINGSGITTFNNNSASHGGAVFTRTGTAAINGSGSASFSYNKATSTHGGAIYAAVGDINISSSGTTAFSNNTANTHGGALYTEQTASLSGTGTTTFNNNSTTNGAGGAIYSVQDTLLNGAGMTTFNGNSASTGGAIYSGRNVTINGPQQTTFINNQANQAGGAIYLTGTLALATQTPLLFNQNTAATNGGAVCLSGTSNGSITNAIFSNNNSGNYGGAISSENQASGAYLNLTNTFFNNNTANQYGGAVFSRANLTLINPLFTNNAAGQAGGAIYMAGSNPNTVLTFNLSANTVINPSPSVPGGYSGDNDIACSSNTASFIKTGLGALILNTQNPSWVAPTLVQQGSMIIGQSSANLAASWGSSTTPSQALTVNNGAMAGGFGTFYTTSATFHNGSTWLVGITPTGQSGHLTIAGPLTLNAGSNLLIQPTQGTYTTGTSYTLATATGGVTNSGINVAIDPSAGLQGLYELGNIIYGTNSVTLTITNTTNLPTSPSFELNDNIISVLGQLNESSFSPKNSEDDFIAHFNFLTLAPLKDRQLSVNHHFSQNQQDIATSLLQAAVKKGPVVVATNQYRLWAAPYYAHGNTDAYKDQPSVRDHHEGFIIGAEKRSLKRKWTIGFMSGFGLGNNTFPQTVNTNTADKDMFFGVYHSLGFFNHARYDIVVNSIFSHHQGQRSGKINAQNSYLALSTYNSHTLSANLETSYQFKLKYNSSIRPSLGFTLARNVRDRYQERNAGLNNRTFAKQTTSTQEVYGGIGLRRQWIKGNYDIKMTALWEHGYELGSDITQQTLYTVNGPKNGYLITQVGQGRHTNYLTAYSSVLNTKTHLKFLVGYSGSIQKHRTVHSLTLKAEYRF